MQLMMRRQLLMKQLMLVKQLRWRLIVRLSYQGTSLLDLQQMMQRRQPLKQYQQQMRLLNRQQLHLTMQLMMRYQHLMMILVLLSCFVKQQQTHR
jgi:hypothetical protein